MTSIFPPLRDVLIFTHLDGKSLEKTNPNCKVGAKIREGHLSIFYFTEKLGLKSRRSTTAFFQLISVPIYYTNDSGKVINHLKNLAVERQSTEP
ncbi:MAG: hypothetical protein V7L05_14140 [Nostoc sp.]